MLLAILPPSLPSLLWFGSTCPGNAFIPFPTHTGYFFALLEVFRILRLARILDFLVGMLDKNKLTTWCNSQEYFSPFRAPFTWSTSILVEVNICFFAFGGMLVELGPFVRSPSIVVQLLKEKLGDHNYDDEADPVWDRSSPGYHPKSII